MKFRYLKYKSYNLNHVYLRLPFVITTTMSNASAFHRQKWTYKRKVLLARHSQCVSSNHFNNHKSPVNSIKLTEHNNMTYRIKCKPV